MAPGTKFARYFCPRIGPLQLGVVLVNITLKTVVHMHPVVCDPWLIRIS